MRAGRVSRIAMKAVSRQCRPCRQPPAASQGRDTVPAGSLPGSMSQAGQRLLSVAKDVSGDGQSKQRVGKAPILSEFIQLYREWITTHRGRPGTQEQQAERWQLVMYGMVAAPNIETAIRFLIRFGKVVWGERGPLEFRAEGQNAVLIFSEPYRPGPEGLILAIWPLALTLCELEFLANASFTGASGRVPQASCLPGGVVRLLFGRAIAYEAGEVALVIPRQYLRRPVAARPTDLPQFFKQLLPLTLGAGRNSPSLSSVAAGLLRDDKRGPEFCESSLDNVSARLGMSASTLRRRLAAEGASYSKIREATYNSLAQDWLRQKEVPIDQIASRLDFSDSFAFRRFFRRLNSISPSAFRARECEQAT
jgi:AraC-like DNA-binding protein